MLHVFEGIYVGKIKCVNVGDHHRSRDNLSSLLLVNSLQPFLAGLENLVTCEQVYYPGNGCVDTTVGQNNFLLKQNYHFKSLL